MSGVTNNVATTRSNKSINLNCPFPRTESFSRRVSYQGPSRWAKLPHDVNNFTSLDNIMVCVSEYYWEHFLEEQIV